MKNAGGVIMKDEMKVNQMTDIMAQFIGFTAKKLPDDVIAKLKELRDKETSPMAGVIYETMFRNQELAVALNRPSCQDTGVLQFWVKCGTRFPLIDDLEALLKEAVVQATIRTPLRHNSVETFDEYNTGKNVGKGTPTVWWEIVPNSDQCEIYTYMAGGGCTLPGNATVLMPGEGYEGVTKFVMDRMTSYGLNACPPLLVGVGVATSVETAALLSKKALLRPIGSHNPNERAAKMEKLLEDGINAIGLGPQGMGGNYSVMGVNIENTARHPSAIGVAVNVGCWSHRRGHIIFDRDLNYKVTTHSGFEYREEN
jgi:L(+)-tartrate dehydratase alpha subunit